MMINIGQAVFLDDEEFAEEMATRRERLGLKPGQTMTGCPLCRYAEVPGLSSATDGRRRRGAVTMSGVSSAGRHAVRKSARIVGGCACTRRSLAGAETRSWPAAVVHADGRGSGAAGPHLHARRRRRSIRKTDQSIAPAYEGWEQNDDGTFNLVFGYMNRNWDQELDVPIGPDNRLDPGGPDRGQPTHFQPRRNRHVFRVRVAGGLR